MEEFGILPVGLSSDAISNRGQMVRVFSKKLNGFIVNLGQGNKT